MAVGKDRRGRADISVNHAAEDAHSLHNLSSLNYIIKAAPLFQIRLSQSTLYFN